MSIQLAWKQDCFLKKAQEHKYTYGIWINGVRIIVWNGKMQLMKALSTMVTYSFAPGGSELVRARSVRRWPSYSRYFYKMIMQQFYLLFIYSLVLGAFRLFTSILFRSPFLKSTNEDLYSGFAGNFVFFIYLLCSDGTMHLVSWNLFCICICVCVCMCKI